MEGNHIDGMLLKLRPQLREPVKVRKILLRYWQDRKAFVWTVYDVHLAVNEQGKAITLVEARALLEKFHKEADQFAPVDWFRLLDRVDQSGLGRKLTKAELNRFLEQI